MIFGLWKDRYYGKYQKQIHAYINELLPFLKRYCEERYDVAIGEVHASWPYYIPKTYDELRAFDRAIHQTYFDDTIQIYVCYGFELKPHPEFNRNFAGYCEAKRGQMISPNDMLYVEMPAFTGLSPVIRSVYEYYAGTSRIFTHELDHRILAYLDSPEWIRGPHSVPSRPDVKWVMPNGSVFYSQRDPRGNT